MKNIFCLMMAVCTNAYSISEEAQHVIQKTYRYNQEIEFEKTMELLDAMIYDEDVPNPDKVHYLIEKMLMLVFFEDIENATKNLEHLNEICKGCYKCTGELSQKLHIGY